MYNMYNILDISSIFALPAIDYRLCAEDCNSQLRFFRFIFIFLIILNTTTFFIDINILHNHIIVFAIH